MRHNTLQKLASIISFFALFLIGHPLFCIPHEDAPSPKAVVLEKDIHKSFPVSANYITEFRNEFGTIKVENHSMDSAIVDIHITTSGNDQEAAQDMMDRIKVDFNTTGNVLTVQSETDGNAGPFKSLVRSVADYAKDVIGDNDLKIDFVVRVPSYVELRVEQKSGVIKIGKIDNKTRFTLEDGYISVEEVSGETYFELNKADTDIEKVENGFFAISSSKIRLQRAGKVDFNSSGSEVTIQLAQELYIDARNDEYKITEVARVRGKAELTQTTIDRLSNSYDFKNTLGSISLKSVATGFELVKINSKLAEVNVHFAKPIRAKFDVEAKAKKFVMMLNESGIVRDFADDKQKDIRITGSTVDDYAGEVSISMPSGSLTLDYAK